MTYSEALAAVESLSDEDKLRLAARLREDLYAPLPIEGEAHLRWLETGEREPWQQTAAACSASSEVKQPPSIDG